MTAFKEKLVCWDCTEKEWIKKFEKYADLGLVRIVPDRMMEVDWPQYVALLNESGRHIADFEESSMRILEINLLLISLGVFSTKIRLWHCWQIVSSDGLNLNPGGIFSPLYFTREEDARAFARCRYSETPYEWVIYSVHRVISKEDVIKASD